MTDKAQRRLIIVRHAKAVEEDAGGDHARPLAPRGQEDAVALGDWLAAHARPDVALCSTATRTRETLAALGSNIPTILRDKLYLASAGELLAQVQSADDAAETVVVVAHNPGLHGLLGMLVETYAQEADAERVVMKFPTAACAILTFPVTSWQEIAPQMGRLEALRWAVDAEG